MSALWHWAVLLAALFAVARAAPVCPPGQTGCPCLDDDSCTDALARCAPSTSGVLVCVSCDAGARDCACDNNNVCAAQRSANALRLTAPQACADDALHCVDARCRLVAAPTDADADPAPGGVIAGTVIAVLVVCGAASAAAFLLQRRAAERRRVLLADAERQAASSTKHRLEEEERARQDAVRQEALGDSESE